jgi:hypothetical protein
MKHARENVTLGSIASGVLGRKPVTHSRGMPQLELPSSCHHDPPAGLLGSGVTRLHGYYEPLRLPNGPSCSYLFPQGVDLGPTRPGSPARVSQVPDCSVDARCPLSPRGARLLHVFVASRSMTGFTPSGRMATPNLITRPKRGHLRYGWHLCVPGLRTSDCSEARPVSYMANEQFP